MNNLLVARIQARRRERQQLVKFYGLHVLIIVSGVSYGIYQLLLKVH